MVYLNNCATSYPKPISVYENIEKYIRNIPSDYSRSGGINGSIDYIAKTREIIAEMFSVKKAEQVIFTSGATEALNLVIKGVLYKGDHVITTETEHNSVLRPLKTLEQKGTIEISIVECDEYGFIEPSNIINQIKGNTRLIVINHASNVTGTVQNIEAITNNLPNREIKILLDASQTAGNIPINFSNLNIDYMAFTGHKYMYSLQGTGCLIIKEGNRPLPLKTGGTGVKSNLLYQPEEMPLYYEAGTPNITGIVSLYYGAKYIIDSGIKNMLRIKKEHIKNIIKLTQSNPLIQPVGINTNIEQLAVFNFTVKNVSVNDVSYILENSYKIVARSGLHCAPLIHSKLGTQEEGTIRISPSVFTTNEEITYFCKAVNEIANAL